MGVRTSTSATFEFISAIPPRVELLAEAEDGKNFLTTFVLHPEDVTGLQELLQEVQRAIYHHHRDGLMLDRRTTDDSE